jgi:hypothetical protein
MYASPASKKILEYQAMLLSSILQILNQNRPQPAAVGSAPKAPPVQKSFSAELESSGLKELKSEIATAAGLLRPLCSDPKVTPVRLPGPNLEELTQIIAKLKEENQTHIVDVFE